MQLHRVRSPNCFPALQADHPAYLGAAMATSLPFLAVFGLGPTELVVILIILLVLFGGSKLPSLAKGLGQSVKEFKKATKDEEEPVKSSDAKKAEPAKSTLPGAN
jgi:sec-independent protein translocase protein TatA